MVFVYERFVMDFLLLIGLGILMVFLVCFIMAGIFATVTIVTMKVYKHFHENGGDKQ